MIHFCIHQLDTEKEVIYHRDDELKIQFSIHHNSIDLRLTKLKKCKSEKF